LEDKLNVTDAPNVINPEVAYSRSSNTNISTSLVSKNNKEKEYNSFSIFLTYYSTNVFIVQKSLYMLEKFAKKKKTGRVSKAGRKDKGVRIQSLV